MKITSITPDNAGMFIVRVYEASHSAASGLGSLNASADTLPSVCSIMGSRHLGGIDLRHFHFLKASLLTPRACAASFTTAQSRCVMTTSFRDYLSPRQGTTWAETGCPTPFNFGFMDKEAYYVAKEVALRARTKRARKEAGFTQKTIAKALGIDFEAYKKWENRGGSTMPPRYHEDFCELTKTRPDWFMSGKGARTVPQAEPELQRRRKS